MKLKIQTDNRTTFWLMMSLMLGKMKQYVLHPSCYTSFKIFFSVFPFRLYQVERLDKTPAVTSISLHACKILFMFTSLNARTSRSVLSRIFLISGGFSLCFTVTNIWLFEREKRLEKNKVTFLNNLSSYVFLLLTSIWLR